MTKHSQERTDILFLEHILTVTVVVINYSLTISPSLVTVTCLSCVSGGLFPLTPARRFGHNIYFQS